MLMMYIEYVLVNQRNVKRSEKKKKIDPVSLLSLFFQFQNIPL